MNLLRPCWQSEKKSVCFKSPANRAQGGSVLPPISVMVVEGLVVIEVLVCLALENFVFKLDILVCRYIDVLDALAKVFVMKLENDCTPAHDKSLICFSSAFFLNK